jgi:hypothetical protein
MSEVGKTITQAIAYVSRVGDECEALANQRSVTFFEVEQRV